MSDIFMHYVHDPLCGWCYGFSNNILKVRSLYPHWKWHAWGGNMVPAQGAQPVSAISGYILQAIPRLEALTGALVGQPYRAALEEGTRIQHSETALSYLASLRAVHPAAVFQAIHWVQKGIFWHGYHPNEQPLYDFVNQSLNEAGYPFDWEVQRQKSTDFQEEVTLIQNWGIRGFPALVGQKNDQLYLLANGFVPLEDLQKTLDSFQQA
jgi:putative protein-disulfide isomerase